MSTSLQYFDANASVGCSSARRPDFPHVADLLAFMDRLGLERALAWDIAARDFHPGWGNQRLLDEIASTPGAPGRVFPSFVLAPPLLYERGGLDTLATAMQRHGVRALRWSPYRSGWALGELEPLLERLLPLQPVLFLNLQENMDRRELLAFAERFPSVPLVLTDVMWPFLPRCLDVMRRFDHVHVETSWMHTWGTLELLARDFGADRVLFGTGFRSHQGAALAGLAAADLTHPDRARIASGNLERLLGLPALPADSPAPTPRVGPLWDRLLAGQPLGVEILDAHGHLGPLGMWVMEEHDPARQAAAALRWMDRLGISTMLVSGEQALFTDPVEGNLALEEQLTPHGGRFLGYLGFNPFYGSELEGRLEDFFSRDFFVGFKLLCGYWAVTVTDPRFTPVWEYAHAHRLPLLLHTWGGSADSPALLADICPRYPDALFLLGHSGGSARGEAEDLAADNPNVYLEWCGSFTTPDSWEDTLARVGADRLVFGSDAVPHDVYWELGRLVSQDFPPDQLPAMLGGTMRRLLSLRR